MCKFSLLVCACIALASTEGVSADRAQVACESIEDQAPKKGFDPVFVAAMAWRESRFDASALGGGGEIGLLQVKPYFVTGRHGPYNVVDLYRVDTNVEAALLIMSRWRVLGGDRWAHCYASGITCDKPKAVAWAEGMAAALRRYMRKLEVKRNAEDLAAAGDEHGPEPSGG